MILSNAAGLGYRSGAMAFLNLTPRVRRLGKTGLIVLAAGLVTAAVVVMLTDDPALDPDEVFPDVVVLDLTRRPGFDFPDSVRTVDLSLNRFIDRFVRVCMDGKYADFRLMLSHRAGDPIVARRFESMFNALKQVRILSVEEVPLPQGFEHGPVYVMLAEYDLKEHAVVRGVSTERRRLAIMRENGEWRIGPVPRELAERLESEEAESEPAMLTSPPASRPSSNTAEGPTTPGAAANRPLRLEP